MRKKDQEFDPKVFLAGTGKGRTLAAYAKNYTIFLQGDPADAIFYIHKGKIKLTVVSKQGKEAVVALLGPGDFFGEGCLAGRPIVGSRTDVPGNNRSLADVKWAGRPMVGSRADVLGNGRSLADAGRPIVGSGADVSGNGRSLADAGRPMVASRADVSENRRSLADEKWAGQSVRMASATALSECSILRMEKSAVIRVLHDQPAFSELLLHHLLSRNIRIEEDLVDQLFNSSEKRLARVLLLLANFGKEGKPELVIPKISQETLAEIVGTTRSRVSFFMNRFRKMGFIQYSGQQTEGLEVHSSLLNVILHD
jgi:CRP-like cAMP-binding protein